MDISCPSCGEREALSGARDGEQIRLTCEACGHLWRRSLAPVCGRCRGEDLQTVPLAIVERSRGTQLSVVGTRPVHLCSDCDADALARYHRNRPNPLMPSDLPTVGDVREALRE